MHLVYSTTYILTALFGMYLREQNHLKKKLDDTNSKVDEIRSEQKEMEEKFNSLRLLSEKQNKKFDELYIVKTSKVSTPV
jgi:peptidoglycan hydrolase CwlO-like protein